MDDSSQREISTFHLCDYGRVCLSLGTKQGCLNLPPASILVYLNGSVDHESLQSDHTGNAREYS